MKAVIIAHGSLSSPEILREGCRGADMILCADGGAEFAYRYGVLPDYLIGDFDSIDDNVFQHFEGSGVKIERYKAEKDYTDTEICVKKALELGSEEICILAGTGGRIDHSLGNIGLLYTIYQNNAFGYIASDDCSIYLCSDEISIRGKASDIISIIPFNGDAEGVTLSGLKYPLNNAFLEFGKPIGISNVMLHDECKISISKGTILVIKNN